MRHLPSAARPTICRHANRRYAPTARLVARTVVAAVRLFDAVPLRTLPPNAITAAAMAFGLASVYQSLALHHPQTAAWFVLLSVLLDKLDGSVARAIKGSSEFGVQFDSFSDCTAFGIAPAALVFASAQTQTPEMWGQDAVVAGLPAPAVLAGICLLYAVMTAVRLARFNVMTASIGPYLFLGLPSTLSGGLLCSAFLAAYELKLDESHPHAFGLFPLIMLVNAVLMVSNLPLPKFKVSKHPAIKAFQLASAAAVYVLVPLRTGIAVVLALLLGYLVVGFGWLGPRMWRAEAATRQAAAS